ncbi:hypothetical protein RclHR1_01630013 [Rhizophagus clarus]|uniref:F-box domain-containing protein n=1 Tax=Rhizophagus clarus TaxID=94130 RepID=A0A2Z6QIT6_9GLOM|nr:hypothetical protein RclHR1_01630013 [Rhizophagus clarus]
MTCSKLFSEDLPEITDEIIQYFRNDFSALYSCILVNRLWCRLAIPLLWENPFLSLIENYCYIEIYLYCLNKYNKMIFCEYKIYKKLLASNALFYYPSFIKYLNTNSIYFSIERWVRATFSFLVEDQVFEKFNDIKRLFLRNPNFMSNIRNLRLIVSSLDIINAISLLKLLYSNCNSISSITFGFLSLFMDEILHIESLQLLLQKSGDYLENFNFKSMKEEYNESRRQLLKLFIEYCKGTRSYDELSPFVLQNLGQVLPFKLEYLHLSLEFNKSDLELFLINSQNTFIKKFVVMNRNENESDSVLFYFTEYIMKKQGVKYLAILESFPHFTCNGDLYFLDDDVNEFNLHNIIVQEYSDLKISIINEIICKF